MTYPGNPTLPADVQQRIRSTFEHTLGLAEKGSRQEAMLGCDFVLRMDPQFEPARRLQQRLENNAGAVAVDDLWRFNAGPTQTIAAISAGRTAAGAGHEDALWADLDGLATELPDLSNLSASAATMAPDYTAAIRHEFESLLSARRFQELQNRAAQEQAAVNGDLELQRLVALAHERMEAAPYVSKFLVSAREALRTGNSGEAARLVEKARSLDPTHPGISELGGSSPEMRTQPISPGFAPLAPLPDAPGSFGGGGDSESERRITQLLDAGQAALDGGDPQAAIDAWSRIFLIDIDHQEAARRIEEARRLKAERDRQVEETLHDGMAALEGGDFAAARGAFQHVVELQPGHLKAREYLQQAEHGLPLAGTTPLAPLATLAPMSPRVPAAPAASSGPLGSPGSAARAAASWQAPAGDALTTPAGLGPESDLQEEILVPPEIEGSRTGEPRREVRSASSGESGRARRLFLVVGGCVLFLILVVGWFLYQKRETWFPNSHTEEAAPAPAPNPIPRAAKLHAAGKTGIAITQLRRIAPGDPHYKEAQELIAKWEAEEAQNAPPISTALGTTAGAGALSTAGQGAPAVPLTPEAARREELLNEARFSFQEGSFLLAASRFGAADKLGHLEPADAAQFATAKTHLVPIQNEVAMFTSHDWEMAIPILWRDHQADPGNKDVLRMLVDSYYDMGVRELQHSNAAKAASDFREAQNLVPDDAEAGRQLAFAQAYQAREVDLLYRIYVKYLALR